MEKQVSLYIHIPFCLSKCDYCDFFSVTNSALSKDDYIDSLCKEIIFRLQEYGECSLKTVYVGGGTPSLLSPEQISRVGELIAKYKGSESFEFTFEVNPDDVTPELIHTLKNAGVNRISCGIQSFSQSVLQNVQRRSSAEQVNKAVELLQQHWTGKLSIDLICGLPHETEETMLDGLKKLCSLKVPHISFYSLCVEEETPLGKAILKNQVDYDYDTADELWLTGRDFLLQNGYEQYEVSNFCLKGNECLHNLTYWSHKDYIGAGAGATGTVYNQNGEGLRWTNTKDIKKYIDFWTKTGINVSDVPQDVEKIRQKASQFEYFMMGLRTKKGISAAEYSEIFGEPMPDKAVTILEKWCKNKVHGHYSLDEKGMLFLNVLLEQLGVLFD